MASCGDTLLACDSTNISSPDTSSRCSATVPVTADPCCEPKPAWGGAGMIPVAQSLSSKSSLPGKKNLWAPSQHSLPKTSFRDLQSEDLARQLTQREAHALGFSPTALVPGQQVQSVPSPVAPSFAQTSAGECSTSGLAPSHVEGSQDTTDSDFLLAQMLQYDYDLEHDMQIERNQKHVNKNSKLSISYNNYKLLPTFTSIEDRDLPAPDEELIDEIEAGELDEPLIPPCGYVQHEGVMVTKHDSAITSRKNTKKMLHLLPLDVNTGDAGGCTINLSNKVFNNLNAISHSDNRRKHRAHDKAEKGTLGAHLDAGTSLALLTMVNNGQLEKMGGVISTGKESVVHAAVVGSLENAHDHQDCVVKIFKVHIKEFKTRHRYIKDDHRFKDRMNKSNSMSNLKLWVEKEYRNLCRVHRAGIPCPAPLHVRHNLLVMSLIGDPKSPAPQLKNVQLSTRNWELAYQQTVQIVRNLTSQCRLVHADLSQFNLLYHDGTVYVIDFAQAVDITHPTALSFLYRDLCNIANFFHRRGVRGVQTGLELLEDITKLDITKCTGRSPNEEVAAVELELNLWRGSDCYDDVIYNFLWNESQLRNQLMQAFSVSDEDHSDDISAEVTAMTLDKTGSSYKEQWITRKTDGFVIGKGQKKKKKSRKNSGSRADRAEEGAAEEGDLREDQATGFCLVDSSDCGVAAATAASSSTATTSTSTAAHLRTGQRVRFDVTDDTDAAADTEDYNGDADTDDFDGDTDDIDTDLAATDHDGDTEGYHGDADDTDTCASDGAAPSRMMVGGAGSVRQDKDDSSDQQQNNNCSSSKAFKPSSSSDKRSGKKKNKKTRARTNSGSNWQ